MPWCSPPLSTGELLVSANELRQRLNKAFGESGWACTPVSEPNRSCEVDFALSPIVEYALFIRRQYVSQAFGHSLSPLTKFGSKGKILPFMSPELRQMLLPETKMVAFQRCCRDFNIGSQLAEEHVSVFCIPLNPVLFVLPLGFK